jgi:TRAP-type mannitol/chloroaromatic compound transport system permease large subunit
MPRSRIASKKEEQQMNLRVVITGAAMVVLALAFFFYMGTMAPRSNDPASMMQTVGMVSGAVRAIGVVMIVLGALRRRR